MRQIKDHLRICDKALFYLTKRAAIAGRPFIYYASGLEY